MPMERLKILMAETSLLRQRMRNEVIRKFLSMANIGSLGCWYLFNSYAGKYKILVYRHLFCFSLLLNLENVST